MKIKPTKVFTFLKESNILVDLKTKLLDVLKDEHETLKPYLEAHIKEKSPAAKEFLINFVMTKVSLPVYLKPFKGIVKKTLNKNFDKVIEFIVQHI